MWRIIAQIFEDIEIMLIESLRRNLSRHIEWEKKEGFSWPAWQALKLREIGRFRKENKQIMEYYTDTISDDIRELLEDQFEEGYHDTEDELEELGLVSPVSEENFFGINKDRVDKLAEEIIAKESNIEKAALRFMDDVYRRTLYKAEVAMSAGAVTLPQAIDMATRDFLNAGINCIEYKDGRRVNIADYVQMALRTAATRSYLNGAAAKRAELGIDTVLVSQYGACSETCLPWQGRVYIDDVWGVFEGERSGEMGKSKNGNWYPLLSVAIKGGLYHPNCRHSHTTWIEGISRMPKALDPKQVGENYKLEQQQRKLERELKRFKRLQAGSLSEEDRRLYGDQTKKKQKELKEFVEKHKDILRRDYWRENVYGMPSMQSDVPNIKQFERYKERLGDAAPQTIEEFNRIKFSKGKEWVELQERYRYAGIVNRILAKYPEAVVFEEPEDIPVEYHKAAENLTEEQKKAIYHYSHYEEGVRMNKYLGGVPGIELDEKEIQNLINTMKALNNMSLPYTTIVWRGTKKHIIKGFDKFEDLPVSKWTNFQIEIDGFTSTSIIRKTSYVSEVQMVILVPDNVNGVGYINEIAYNKLNAGNFENGLLLEEEYEVLLQSKSLFTILEAQKFRGKPIIVVRWEGNVG